MRIRIRSILVPLLAVTLFAGNCDDEGPTTVVPPPDLTGTYDLASIVGALLTGGVELTPTSVPPATGTMTVTQTSSSGSVATGTYQIDLLIAGNPTGDAGTYTIDTSNGSWSQDSSTQGFQSVGTFTLSGSRLTVVVATPAAAASTSVWDRQ